MFCIAQIGLSLTPLNTGSVADAQTKSENQQEVNVSPVKTEGFKIIEVKTEGLKRIERDAILEKISLKAGAVYSEEKAREDIEALYGMNYFDAIEIKKDLKTDAVAPGYVMTFSFLERPIINEVTFEGNDKVSTSDLEDVIKVKKWSIVDVNKIQADLDLLQKHYEDKGYYLAKITHELQPVKEAGKEGEVKLIYHVADYDKVEIKEIVFLNNTHYPDEKLKSVFMETKEGTTVNFLSSSGTFKEASFKTDLQRLTFYYLENGFIKFRYENPIVTVSEDKRYVYISIYVEEGEQYKVSSYDFSGDLLYPKEELQKSIKLLPGKIFSISERNNDIQRLTEKYQDLGYAFVNVIPKMDMNDTDKTVSIDYQFEKGNLVYFNEIRVVGNTKTHDKVIRREMRVHEGQLFSGSKLRISKERIERLGFFAPGELQFNQVPVKNKDDQLDLEIQVKERSTGSVTLGAGYSSVQGFFFQGRIQEINLFGRGQNLGLEVQWGREDIVRSFSLDFTDPYAWDTDWSAGFTLFMTNSPLPYRYLTRRSGIHLKLGHPLSDDIQGFITYKLEQMKILRSFAYTSLDPSLPSLTADPTLDSGILSSIVFSVVRDVRNNRFETTEGNYQSASLEFAGLAGVKNFTKMVVNNRYYTNFIGSFVFKNSTEMGAIANTGGRGIPPAEKFYLGGPWNMRGYDAFSLAPFIFRPGNNTFEQIGGSSEIYSLFELEHPLIKEAGIKWVTFFDIGNSFATVPVVDGGSFELRKNWGFGIRWFSPLGPLRFEWGFPLNRRPVPGTSRIEDSPVFIFFIGQPF